ncbi:tetratricopeptide repeat protein [Anaerobacillus isosaccharinicus]|uniref:Tetratricopeptide repeat protein n=1 Tax=Anaerobacillus isosaccharinicus TaxID=1532552 RepID=A0A1S2MEQ9_9BACI|nr:tetratricopeptide repeat protein [Anaerobacillus isosaccharinicus]MBA5587852.1 tetratricopeptide repeat protein [Anaerobacillus isosaccharinicus]QOY33994.1 tetratricopeptide repeat protein [Anaerobacillus isosaccharinicus]
MNEEQKKLQENVVLFPGVVEKLVGKGMEALKEKKFSDALSFFEQALEIDPDHPQGRFGVALSLIEQSRLDEAKAVTEKMLKEDIGSYYDILQVHISLLVQLGQYDDVVAMLEGIMGEEKLPANLAESFYHLLHFSRQMVDDGPLIDVTEEIQVPPEDLVHMLNTGVPEKQWLAIQMLGKLPGQVFFEAITQFLKTEEHDPVLKSMVLQLLKEKNIEEKVEIHKFGKIIIKNVSDLENVFHEKFGKDTLVLVSEHLESENPSLYEMISHVWWHYLFALYPISPEPLNTKLWAAAIHKIGGEMTGMDIDELQIAKQYHVDLEEMLQCSLKIMEIEQGAFKG